MNKSRRGSRSQEEEDQLVGWGEKRSFLSFCFAVENKTPFSLVRLKDSVFFKTRDYHIDKSAGLRSYIICRGLVLFGGIQVERFSSISAT